MSFIAENTVQEPTFAAQYLLLTPREVIATPFAGNVPNFDLLAANESGGTVALQVKASRGHSWSTQVDLWLQLRLEGNKQINDGLFNISDSSLIYIFVAIASLMGQNRYFILTKGELQKIYAQNYQAYMEPRGWIQPKNPASFDCRCTIDDLAHVENNWQLITERLGAFGIPPTT